MSWIKEASKLGKYHKSYEGFRFYCVKEGKISESVVERKGDLWNKTEFTKAEYIAVDKTGLQFEGEYWFIVSKIDKEIMRRKMSKRYGEELEWR